MLGKGLACLAISSLFLMSAGAHAAGDVFGTATPNAAQASELRDRMTALEKELKELKSQGATGTIITPSGKTLTVPPPPPPVPGLEELPSQGKDKQEVLRVEKELTHEVIGTVNGQLLVRDGSNTFVMSQKEFKAFEKAKRQKAVRKLSIDSVDEKFKLPMTMSIPQVLPTQQDIQNGGGQFNQAAAAVNQAKAIEANGGNMPTPPATSPSTSKAPAMPAAKK